MMLLFKLREISPSKSNGPDRLPNWILKTYMPGIIAQAVADILNCSFRSSKVPYVWKLAVITPIDVIADN